MKCSGCGKEVMFPFYQNMIGEFFLCDECLSMGLSAKSEQPVRRTRAGGAGGIACPKCGTCLDEFAQSGYLGCEKCYKTFSREIEKFLPHVQNGPSHIGKTLKK